MSPWKKPIAAPTHTMQICARLSARGCCRGREERLKKEEERLKKGEERLKKGEKRLKECEEMKRSVAEMKR
eukprot:765491-Hanusia_phi.AAC.5